MTYRTFSDLRKRLGDQARSVLYVEGGKVEFKFLDDVPAAVLTLDYKKDVWREAPATMSRTPRTEIRNSLWAYSQRDYAATGQLADRYGRAKNFRDLRTFTDELQEDLELDLVQSTTTADAVASFQLAQKKRQRLILDLVAWWNVVGLDQADYVSVTNHPILTAHGGGTLVFRVVQKRYLFSDEQPGRTALKLLEIPGTTAAIDSGLPNVVITVDEIARGLTGTLSNLIRVTSADGSGSLTDLNPLWFDLLGGRWFDDSEISTAWFRTTSARSYESPAIDKGKTGPSPIAITLPTKIFESVAWFSDLPDEWFPDRPTDWFNRFGDNTASLTIEVNRSDDNVTYAGWEAWVAGQSYSFRYIKVRVRVTPTSPTASLVIDSFLIVLDVPDVVVEISDFVAGAGGTVLTFATFGPAPVVVPEVKVNPTGASAGYTAVVKNLTLTTCLVELRNELNVLAAGVADITLAYY